MAEGIAVLDLGKTNLKLVIVDPAGRAIETAMADNRPRPGPPYPHADVDLVWDWILTALAEAGRRHEIRAIVPTTYGSTAALIGDDGLALPVLDYEAEPPDVVKDAYAGIAPPFAEVYAPTNPAGLTLGRQIFWQETAFPEAFAKTRAIMPYPQYWAWRLTGIAAAEATSLGAQTHLWDPVAQDYSGLARARRWNELLPPLRRAGDMLGTLLPVVAAATGLPPDTPVLTGIHDSNANYFRYLAAGFEDFTLMSTGTWLITFNAAQPLDLLDPARDTNSNTDAFGRPVACSRFMLGREYEFLAGNDARTAATPDAVAGVVAAGAMALPSFTDSGGPCPGTGGRGRIVETRPDSPAARVALAALYGALMSSEALDAVGSASDVIIDGGFAGHA
ncbi:MAG TPA: FGGY family carbohydrate kinase, partial [Alphaproteobacteria bacterium]|nr:FGGY family carbohydrate kinase [Alphaproteobacteria bacterium]